jgi:hypothetical protein
MEGEPQLNTNADDILGAVERGEDPSQLTVAPEAPAQQAATPEGFRKELTINGEKVVVDDEAKYDQWAQQGRHYSQQMAELNQQKAAWEAERSQMESKLNQYRDVDSYAKENPEWWQHVENNYQARDAQNLTPEIKAALEPVLKDFSEVKEFANKLQIERQEELAKKEDQALKEEVSNLSKEYPEIDFTAADQTGQPFELQILKHAEAQGIPSFRASFLDYNQSQLQTIYESRGRKAAEDAIAKRNQQGILGRTQAPTQGKTDTLVNPRNKSWDDVLGEAKEAFASLQSNN